VKTHGDLLKVQIRTCFSQDSVVVVEIRDRKTLLEWEIF